MIPGRPGSRRAWTRGHTVGAVSFAVPWAALLAYLRPAAHGAVAIPWWLLLLFGFTNAAQIGIWLREAVYWRHRAGLISAGRAPVIREIGRVR